MTQFYRYRSAYGATAWTVDLGNDAVRLGALDGLTEMAEHCQVGTSSIVIDDPSATVGHSSDAIIGHQRFELDDTAMASGNRRVYTGIIGRRTYRRGDSDRKGLRLAAAREIEVELHDLNSLLSLRVIPQEDTDAKRPSESVSTRLSWILGTTYLSGLVADNGLVVSSTKLMDKTDYRGSRPVNVVNDCELAAGYYAFVYPDETKTVIASLFFDDANTSTAYTSTLAISNVLSDVDTTTAASFLTGTTFAPSSDGNLQRDPSELGSGAYLPYAKGAVYETRAATVTAYGYRDLSAPNANVKTSSRASALAQRFLWEHHTEDDEIDFEVEVPPSKVNSIRAGHRLSVKFSHLPGYESATWTRVKSRTVIQGKTDDRYTLRLTVSPQEAAQPAGAIVQSAFDTSGEGGINLALPNPVTIGNLLVAVISDRSQAEPIAPSTDPAANRFGAGAWTDRDGTRVSNGVGPTDGDGVRIYTKVADDTSNVGFWAVSNAVVGIYELSGFGSATYSEVHKLDQTSAVTMTIGSLGTAASGTVAIMVGNWFDGSYPLTGAARSWAPTTGWTTDRLAPAYYGGAILWNAPASYIAHALGTGAALSASGTRGSLEDGTGEWCGAAILITP